MPRCYQLKSFSVPSPNLAVVAATTHPRFTNLRRVIETSLPGVTCDRPPGHFIGLRSEEEIRLAGVTDTAPLLALLSLLGSVVSVCDTCEISECLNFYQVPERSDATAEVWRYTDLGRHVYLAKYRSIVTSAQSVADLLNRHTNLHPRLRPADVVVSVPSSSAGTGRMDLAAYCAREIARERRVSVVALQRNRTVSSQKDVPRDERIANQMNSMVLSTRIQGARALILDDIYTDGGTMREACRATRAAGARVVMALNAAKTVTGAQGFWL